LNQKVLPLCSVIRIASVNITYAKKLKKDGVTLFVQFAEILSAQQGRTQNIAAAIAEKKQPENAAKKKENRKLHN